MMGVALWALWVRRFTVFCRYERAVTANIVILAVAIYLSSPLLPAILDHDPPGLCNLEIPVAHVLLLVGAIPALYTYLIRFADDVTLQRFMAQWVTRPLTVAIPVMFALFIVSTVSDRPIEMEIFDLGHHDAWLRAYVTAVTAASVYLLLLTGRVLLMLRNERNTVLDLHAAWLGLSLLAYTMSAVSVITPLNLFTGAQVSLTLAAIVWSVAAAYSWRQRSRPLRIVHPEALKKFQADQ